MARHGVGRASPIVAGLLAVVLLLLFCPNPRAVHEESASFVCVTRERALAEALMMYATENADHLPTSATWPQAVMPYLKGDLAVLNCPSRHMAGEAMYAVRGDRKLSDPVAAMYQALIYEVRREAPASPHRTYPHSLWAYREWRQGKPGLDRRPDAYMWVTYDDGHYAAKAEFSPRCWLPGMTLSRSDSTLAVPQSCEV